MKISVISGRELSPNLVSIWRALQHSNPALVSPYFSPEFTQAVAAVRDDVEIAMLEEGNQSAGFFPFQRGLRGVGIPVGGIFSDYQGLVCAPGFECDPRELLKSCRLIAWDFDHLLASQTCFAPFHQECEASPLMDFSKSYEVYAAGCNAIKAEQRKLRRIEKEIGPLRFVAHSTNASLLDQTLAWKSQQYFASGKPDLFALGWTRPLVERIHAVQTKDFAGMLSLLYAGDWLVAGHFGMRSRAVWHYWFPAYDEAMAKYSPGLILLLKMAEHALTLGLHTIDLGKGMSLYKERLMNNYTMVAVGSVELPSLRSFRRTARRRLHVAVAASPLAGPVRTLVRWARGETKQKK